MNSNEFGCKLFGETCIKMKNGDEYYVDNSVDDIQKHMESPEDSINIELTKTVSKGKKCSIQKNKIEKFEQNNKEN